VVELPCLHPPAVAGPQRDYYKGVHAGTKTPTVTCDSREMCVIWLARENLDRVDARRHIPGMLPGSTVTWSTKQTQTHRIISQERRHPHTTACSAYRRCRHTRPATEGSILNLGRVSTSGPASPFASAHLLSRESGTNQIGREGTDQLKDT
jgi:hypothetical protein